MIDLMREKTTDWQGILQEFADLLARPGGILAAAGYRLKVTKESAKRR